MGLRLSRLTLSRLTGGGPLGAALARVMPATERLQVVEGVIVAGLDVIDLIRGCAAVHTERVAGLALVPVTPEHAHAACAPVGR